MARPMRTPVQWDSGSVSVAPIAPQFKGILEEFGIDESAYSAEGGFGRSGLLGWEPADFISPEVVWGTQFVSGAPPPSAYGDVSPSNGKKDDEDDDDEEDESKICLYGKYPDGSCNPSVPPDDEEEEEEEEEEETGGDNGDWQDVSVWDDTTGPEPDWGLAGQINDWVPPEPVIPDISGLLDPMDEYDFGYVAPQVDDFSWGYIDQDPWTFEGRRGGRR